jgi:regulator of protease activity HflC (stomatin/prohibitin superfamily)
VYSQFFSGPGIILAHCDQAAYRTNGIDFLGIAEPGLTFTGMFELPVEPVDLRPQLRAFFVDALTKDGIPIRVLIFIPFRIQHGKQKVELGKSFPFRRKAIFEAISQKPVERISGEGDQQELVWNVDLVPMVATRIIQDIICNYKVDELCAADDPDRDPRMEIVPKIRAEVKKAMIPYGIEVLGGGISNILPVDKSILERRVENWRTEWVRQMYVELSEGKAERKRQLEEARAEAEAEVVIRLGQVVEECLADGASTQAALALRFIDCVGEMVSEKQNQWPPPPDLEKTLTQLRGKLVRNSRADAA